MGIAPADRINDARLRCALRAWMQANDGIRRFLLQGNDDDEQELARATARLQRLSTKVPIYEGQECVAMGEIGGDTELAALVSVLGCAIATVGSNDSRLTSMVLPIPNRRGNAACWMVCGLAEAIQLCHDHGLRLVILVYYPMHWHVMLPLDADGRVLFGTPTPSALQAGLERLPPA